jgi:hypothetical protein
VFSAVNGFTEERINGEDCDLALRLGVIPSFVQITTPATFAYREHETGISSNMKRTIAGAWFIVRAEKQGRYPGGKARAAERHQILTRHIRPVTLSCLLQRGLRQEAWRLYRATFAWNGKLGRFRYLTAFPFLAVMSSVGFIGKVCAGRKTRLFEVH